MRDQFGDERISYCEFRNKSNERKSLDVFQPNEDQIGGKAKTTYEDRKERIKEKNKFLLKKWNKKEKVERSISKVEINSLLANLDCIPEEVISSDNANKMPQGEVETIPLLSIDVNFGPNMHDKITVYLGDNLKQLAHEFTVKHKLTKALENKLFNMLEDQVKKLV
jgi:hypothetical protein